MEEKYPYEVPAYGGDSPSAASPDPLSGGVLDALRRQELALARAEGIEQGRREERERIVAHVNARTVDYWERYKGWEGKPRTADPRDEGASDALEVVALEIERGEHWPENIITAAIAAEE